MCPVEVHFKYLTSTIVKTQHETSFIMVAVLNCHWGPEIKIQGQILFHLYFPKQHLPSYAH